MTDASEPTTLDRVPTPRGELVLRRSGDDFEIISNGVFLMDTSDGTSERLLVDAAVERCPTSGSRLLIGGLGVGFSLVRAVGHKRLDAIDVVEISPSIVDWHARYLGHITAPAMADPRVRIIEADILKWLGRAESQYDAICLDTDNGPNWLVHEANASLYAQPGLQLAAACLRRNGVLAVWSAQRDDAYEQRLRDAFTAVEVLEVPRDRGVPDVIYLGRVA
ncbi:MAG TPA: spermidine synthase [Micromonosporaceae bacterium]|jgi:spermidine synthase